MLHFIFQGNGCFLLFEEEIFFEGCFIVDCLGCDDADIAGGVVELRESEHLAFAGEGKYENTMLEFFESDSFEVIAENVTKESLLLRDIERDDTPQVIPIFWAFDLERTAKEFLALGISFALVCESKRDGAVRASDFFEESHLAKRSDRPIEAPLVYILPSLDNFPDSPEIGFGRVGSQPDSKSAEEKKQELLLHWSEASESHMLSFSWLFFIFYNYFSIYKCNTKPTVVVER